MRNGSESDHFNNILITHACWCWFKFWHLIHYTTHHRFIFSVSICEIFYLPKKIVHISNRLTSSFLCFAKHTFWGSCISQFIFFYHFKYFWMCVTHSRVSERYEQKNKEINFTIRVTFLSIFLFNSSSPHTSPFDLLKFHQ